jgi:phosphopantothenate synthetase
MADAKKREVAESVFQRNERREAEIKEALSQEEARHAAVLKNMQRLRALRLSREQKDDGRKSA